MWSQIPKCKFMLLNSGSVNRLNWSSRPADSCSPPPSGDTFQHPGCMELNVFSLCQPAVQEPPASFPSVKKQHSRLWKQLQQKQQQLHGLPLTQQLLQQQHQQQQWWQQLFNLFWGINNLKFKLSLFFYYQLILPPSSGRTEWNSRWNEKLWSI